MINNRFNVVLSFVMCRCGLLTDNLHSENQTKILKEKEGWEF